MKRPGAAAAAALGGAAGFLSGLLGVGGGIVMVPILVLAFSFGQHRAHATSMGAILPIAAAGTITFAAAGSIDYAVAGMLALGAVVGAPLGVRLLARLPERVLRGVFVVGSVIAGVRLVV